MVLGAAVLARAGVLVWLRRRLFPRDSSPARVFEALRALSLDALTALEAPLWESVLLCGESVLEP